MKNKFFKLIGTVVLSLALVNSAFGVQETFVITTSASPVTTNVISRGGTAFEISIVNGATLPANYAIFDAPATNSVRGPLQGYFTTYYSNGAYTVWNSYLTNITRMYTNYYGVTNSITKSNVLVSFSSTQVAATNNYRMLFSGVVPATNTVTIPLEGPLTFIWGLTVTNQLGTNSSVIINYTPAL